MPSLLIRPDRASVFDKPVEISVINSYQFILLLRAHRCYVAEIVVQSKFEATGKTAQTGEISWHLLK